MRLITLPCLTFAAIALVQPAPAVSVPWTPNDPFVGKWRLDVSRSTIVDDMRVEALGANRYAFNFEGAPTETVIADGTDQPGLPGTTLAVRTTDAHRLAVVRKQGGRIIVSANWTLSPDGRTLRDSFTSVQSDGSTTTTDYLYRRVSGTSGFAGVWESLTQPAGLKLELEIRPYGRMGLRFVSPASDNSVAFDGQDHAVAGAKDGLTLSGRRGGVRALDYTETSRGEVKRSRHFELSNDGQTMTETIRLAGQPKPDVFVFARE